MWHTILSFLPLETNWAHLAMVQFILSSYYMTDDHQKNKKRGILHKYLDVY